MAGKAKLVEAVAYIRTSSASNVGADKDSDKRQRTAIEAFAKAKGYEIVAVFYDAAVSGADPIETRPGFSALLDRIEGNGVRTVIVEDTSRFARDMKAYVLGIALLRPRGVCLLASNGDNLTDDTDEMTEGMIQIAAVFSQIEKKRLVRKLRVARERKRLANGGKCEGRKSWAEINPELVKEAKRLRRRSPKGHQRSLRDVADELGKLGFTNQSGRGFSAASVASMLST